MNTQLNQAMASIREMIVRGKLAPGQRVAEAPLAELLGMSRTPIRQALPLLAQEGLLLEHTTRGFVVRTFTPADIVDAIDLRGLLEGFAAGRLAERGISKSLRRELHASLDDGDAILRKRYLEESDGELYADFNVHFHGLIVKGADCPILSEAIERNARIPFAGAQSLVFFDKTHLEQMYDLFYHAHQQHHEIVHALEAGRSGRVEALMREHANTPKRSIRISHLQAMTGETASRVPLLL